MRKLFRVVFSRYFISAAVIAANLALIIYLLFFAFAPSSVLLFALILFDAVGTVSIITRDANPEYKIPWLVIILAIPYLGIVIYFLLSSSPESKKRANFMKRVYKSLDGESGVVRDAEFSSLKHRDELAAGKAFAILNDDPLAKIYTNTESRVYSDAEEMFLQMLSDLKGAEKYIFLEYFIIEDGYMWQSILEILQEKSKCGVEVRVLYDDIGCMGTLPSSFPRRLNSLGISCRRFSPVTPRISITHNNRDHRKIMVIDGKISYTGGVNIADEYINRIEKYGHWKDGGIRLFGEASVGFLKLFLSMWNMNEGKISDISPYLPTDFSDVKSDGGYYLPFGSGPYPIYERPVGKNVLMNIINQAKRSIYITTPYLIIDYDLTEALRNASLRGVDVRIITPGIADKKIVKVMTKNSYPYLIMAGVKIYEYSPGFIHGKMLVCDGIYAVVGTINFDYRSLAHHYEDAVWIYDSPIIFQLEQDFHNTLLSSAQKKEEEIKLSFAERIIRNLIRLFAPLL